MFGEGTVNMQLNHDNVSKLSRQQGWSQNELARQIGITRGSLSNALHGRRGAGRKLLAGLLQLFPEESVMSLTVRERQAAI